MPEYSKQMIDGAYKSMVEQEQFVGEFVSKKYRKKFEYCQEADYKYDHKDYYNIPGLRFDDEHSKEGFLTPVFSIEKPLYILFLFQILRWIFSRKPMDISGKKTQKGYMFMIGMCHLDLILTES